MFPHHSITLRSPLAADQQPDSIQNSSHLLPHYFWYSSFIPLWVASSLLSFPLSLFSLGYSDFPCPKGVQKDSWGEILSVYWTCRLEISSFLCQARRFTLLFQVKTENPPPLLCPLICRFLSTVSTKLIAGMRMLAVCVWLYMCVCLCAVWVVACNLCACACMCVCVRVCVCVCMCVC